MRYFKISSAFVLFLLCLAGCANSNSIYRKLDVDSGKGALIDIKQRAIIVSRYDGVSYVCAEPSPDALSSYAAELAAEAKLPKGESAKLAAAFQESSAFTGLRTQSIQLLRDALYRLCEGHMSGALDWAQYDLLMRRYQKYMVALLAIEQLTGTIRVPPVTINTQGSAEAARSISEMRSEIDSIDTKIASLEEDKDADGTTDDQKKEIGEQIEDLENDRKEIEKGIEKARGLAAGGSATAVVSTSGIPAQRSDKHIQEVSKVVEGIVRDIINTDDMGELCMSSMQRRKEENEGEGIKLLKQKCADYIENINLSNKMTLELKNALLRKIEEANSADDIKKLVETFTAFEKAFENPGVKLKATE